MPDFVRTALKVEASRRRVISLWYGDVDRVAIKSNPQFTGAAVLATIFTLSGHLQYHVIFISLMHKIIETWRVEPAKIPLSEAPNFEKEILSSLNSHGIELATLPAEHPMFNKILTILPMAFDDQNQTAPASLFDSPDKNNYNQVSCLSDDDIKTVRNFLKLF